MKVCQTILEPRVKPEIVSSMFILYHTEQAGGR